MEASDRTFEIAACLGRGGFGEVYRARMLREGGLEAEVALKVLRRDIDPDGQAVQRLKDEGLLLSRLNHPAILKVHDLVLLAGRISLVTEYVDGDDLTACIEPPDAIGERALLQVIARVASALDAAWTAQPDGASEPLRMVHRDIKPSNIRLSRHGDVKLLDFGIARTDSVEREARTRTDMMVGSPAYMAPERFLDKRIQLESDVFSLGAVLYEGLGGGRFYGDLPVPMQVGLAYDDTRFAAHLEGRLADLEVSETLLELLQTVLAYEPSRRPSPGELAHRCDALADSLSGPTLARYCRNRAWSTTPRVVGELDGTTLSEGSVERPRPAPSEVDAAPLQGPVTAPGLPPPPGEREAGSWLGWAFVGAGGLGLVGMLALVVLGVLGVVALPFALPLSPDPTTPPGDAVDVEAPVPAEPVVPEPTPTPPEPEPEPVAPEPTPGSAPAPEPHPSDVATPAPAPAPGPPPEPAGPPPGRVELKGDVVAMAVGSGGSHMLPADLAPGAYLLQARFNGRDAVDAGEVVVRSGATITVSCSARMTRCSLGGP